MLHYTSTFLCYCHPPDTHKLTLTVFCVKVTLTSLMLLSFLSHVVCCDFHTDDDLKLPLMNKNILCGIGRTRPLTLACVLLHSNCLFWDRCYFGFVQGCSYGKAAVHLKCSYGVSNSQTNVFRTATTILKLLDFFCKLNQIYKQIMFTLNCPNKCPCLLFCFR